MDRLQSMRVFVRVADNGSFARTAAQMELSAAVVTRHVAELEAHLGVRLLNRTTRSLSLTGAGQVYLERCRQILEEIDDADATISSASREPKGTLRVLAPVSFSLRNMAPLAKLYHEKYPTVQLDLTLSDRPVDLVDEGYDVGIVFSKMIHSETVVSRLLSETRILVCASPTYLATRGTPTRPEELLDHVLLGVASELLSHERVFAGPSGEIRMHLPCTFLCNNTALVRQSTLLGHGIALLPTYLIGNDIQSGSLVVLMPEYRLPSMDVNLVYPSRKYLSAKTRAFIDTAIEYFRKQAPDKRADCWMGANGAATAASEPAAAA